jgi:hypothetical protein
VSKCFKSTKQSFFRNKDKLKADHVMLSLPGLVAIA